MEKESESPLILVLEDEGIIQLDLEFRLSSLGYDCIFASNCSDFDNLYRNFLPDYVILDNCVPLYPSSSQVDNAGMNLAMYYRTKFSSLPIALYTSDNVRNYSSLLEKNNICYLPKSSSDKMFLDFLENLCVRI